MSVLLIFRLLVAILLFAAADLRAENACAEFQKLIKATYDFKPSKLSQAEQDIKSKAMDKVWNAVKASPAKLIPCLRAAIDDPHANAFFRFDGSNMLATFDPADQSKLTQIAVYATADFDDIDLQMWVATLAFRGAEGFDTSSAAARWMTYSPAKAHYYLVEHGGVGITWDIAALFLYASMDEKFATPALLKILAQKDHPAHKLSLSLLCLQATPESVKAIQQLDPNTLSAEEQEIIAKFSKTPVLKPSPKPRVTREECLAAFQGLVKRDRKQFDALIEKEPDNEADMVAVLKPEDMPVLRQARRLNISRANPHVIENHYSFTKVIAGLLAKPEFAK